MCYGLNIVAIVLRRSEPVKFPITYNNYSHVIGDVYTTKFGNLNTIRICHVTSRLLLLLLQQLLLLLLILP